MPGYTGAAALALAALALLASFPAAEAALSQRYRAASLKKWRAAAQRRTRFGARSVERLVLDDQVGMGRLWEGVGAISGGGATSKLLFDYPKESADQLLDLLFKPGLALNLQMLKVEIGGDTDSTEGAEPSHMHANGEVNFDRGYEWWLMKEAKKRNPDIKLYGLPWGWPGAIDPKASATNLHETNVFSNVHAVANYTLSWLLGAKQVHGLDIDYVGQWNEQDAPPEYALALRAAVANSELAGRTIVLDRIEHYAGSSDTPDNQGCAQHANAKPGEMWADEEGSIFDGRSARCLARILNRNYISKCKTATFQWHLVSSFYSYLPWPRCGLAVANEPWSGAFEVTSPLWAVAHTTQFAPIGWRYAAHGAGVNMLGKGGSMVTRVSPDMRDFSIVLEKIDSKTSACGHGENPAAPVERELVVIELRGTFLEMAQTGKLQLNVWRSNLSSSSDFGVNPPDSQLFQKKSPMIVGTDGFLQLWVEAEEVITLTTLRGGNKAEVVSPPRTPFPIPYTSNFDAEKVGAPPRLWFDQMGAWEIQKSPYGDADTRGNVMRQVVPVYPQCWGYMCESPSTNFGPSTFKGDITVSLDVRLEDYSTIAFNPIGLNYSAVVLKVEKSGQGSWFLGQRRQGVADFGINKWHSLSLRMLPDGTQDVTLDGKLLSKSMSLLESGRRIREDQTDSCDENTFPLATTGKRHLFLKPGRAETLEGCRQACCRDENLCDVYQFDGTSCEIGRAAYGYEKDNSNVWAGATRWPLPGWHLRMRLGKYMGASIDNFKLFKTEALDD